MSVERSVLVSSGLARSLPLSILLGVTWAGLSACGPSAQEIHEENAAQQARSRALAGASGETEDRCEADDARHEVSEYDTSGDNLPDVRRVFLRVGEGSLARLVLICREADLNTDGTKDVVRYYSDAGRPMREEADRDFDGQMDEIIFFEDGRVARMEQDTTGNGQVDTKLFYERGQVIRSERDIANRSTPSDWHPDRWEYFENGRMIRMGTDLDGDGLVDQWDRDEIYRDEQQARERAEAEAQERAEAEAEDRSGEPAEGESNSI